MDTLSFEAFWTWLQGHVNCVLRVGTQDAVLLDDDDLHWYVGSLDGTDVVQVIRGKRLMGEIVIDPERVTYVQAMGAERKGEYLFEAISESETDRLAAYSFVLVHDLDSEAEPRHGRGVQ